MSKDFEKEDYSKHEGNAYSNTFEAEGTSQFSPPPFDINAEQNISTEIPGVAQLSPDATIQMKNSKDIRKLVPHVKVPVKLNEMILGINAGMQFHALGKEMWDSIQKLKSQEGILEAVGKYMGIDDGNSIESTFDKYKKRNEELDPSYNQSYQDITDEQAGGSSNEKRYDNAIEGTKEIALKASYRGLQTLAKLKKLTLTDAFFWGLDQVVSKGYKDEVSDIKKIAGWDKAKDFGKSKAIEAIALSLSNDFLNSYHVTKRLKAAGYTNKEYREKAILATQADFKQSIIMMLNNTGGVSIDKGKFWKDMGNVKGRDGAVKFLRKADSYLTVNTNKGLKHNDVIFNSRFIRHFDQAYAKAKSPVKKG